MGGQSVRQAARRAALEAQAVQVAARHARERRASALAVAVSVALADRDAAVARCEQAAGRALVDLLREGFTLREAVAWCGGQLTVREAARLRDLAAGAEEPR